MAKKNIKSISKAIFSRLLVITHIIFLYLSFFLTNNDKNNLFSLLMIVGIVLICIEGVYTIIKRQGQDWKWGSAIASSSLATEWLKGKTVDQAVAIDNMDLVEELNLPPVKIHCSVLAEDAIKAAINDYRTKNGLEQLVFEERIH